MATLYITEFSRLATNPGIGNYAESGQMGALPAEAHQRVTFTAATQSAVFSANTTFIRVVSSDNACMEVGANPTAADGNLYLAAGVPEYFGVAPGARLSVVAV